MYKRQGQSYGEWAEPEDVKAFAISEFVSPHPEETTAYIVYLMEQMEKIARLLGHDADACLLYTSRRKDRRVWRRGSAMWQS